MTDVAIVGGGVIGLTAAWELAQAGRSVVVLDRSAMGQEASWAGAGMIPPGDLENAAVHALADLSARMWPALSERLLEETGIDNGYRRTGALCALGPSGEELNELACEWQQRGVPVQLLSGDSVLELEPGLNPDVSAALHVPGVAQVRNPRHLRALQAAGAELGVQLLPETAFLGWEHAHGRIQAIRTPAGKIAADQFLVAAGAWSSQVLASLGHREIVTPVRGQIVLLHDERRSLRHIIEFGRSYLVPRDDGRVLVGSTEEFAGFEKGNTLEAVAELRELANFLVPQLREVTVERTWSGLRPYSVYGRPSIGPAPGFENLFIAAGHYRSGLSSSPATGRLLRQMMCGEELELTIMEEFEAFGS